MGNCCCTSAAAAATAHDIRKSIRKDPVLMAITEKFRSSLLPAFKSHLADLGRCLELAHFRLEPIHAAVILFEKNKRKKGLRRRRSMMMKVQEFKMTSGNAFASLNSQDLQLMLEQLETLMVELRRWKEATRAGICSTQRWRRLWTTAFTVVFVSVLACSVALAALAVLPLLAISAAAAIATALKAVSELGISQLFDEREKRLEEKKEVVEAMRGYEFSLSKAESILALAEKLRVDYCALQEDVEFVLQMEDDESAVEVGMVAIKENLDVNGGGGIRNGIECLKKKVEALFTEIGEVEDEFHKFIRD